MAYIPHRSRAARITCGIDHMRHGAHAAKLRRENISDSFGEPSDTYRVEHLHELSAIV